MQEQATWVFLLAGTVTFITVFIQILTKTGAFRRVLAKKADWRDQIIVVLFFGGFSVLGTYIGIRFPSGAIGNVRDLGPMIAGFTGGPLIGLGAGLIGGIHRYFLGGFTRIPCSLATILAGLIAGIVYKLNHGNLIGLWPAVLYAALIECLHMGLVLLIARPFSEALAAVEATIFPMILANSVGVAINVLFIRGLPGQGE
jgi:sigma-B regulation protein RsbU (phosphoserine phosphatase)